MSLDNGQTKNFLDNQAPTEKSKTVVVNSIKLNPEEQIPIGFGQDNWQILQGKKYIPFISADDCLPNLFWKVRLQSTTQSACISTIAQTTIGEGLYVTNLDKEKEVDKDFLEWIDSINNDNQSLNEICRTIVDAKATDGNAWIQITKGQFSNKKWVKPYLHPTLVCRLGAIDPKIGRPTSVVRSNQFSKPDRGVLSNRSLKAVEIHLYSKNVLDKSWTPIDGELNTMIHLKNEVPGIPFYGIPKSHASLRYQVLEYKSAQGNIDNFDNNMILSALLIFESAMTTEEAAASAKEIIKTHTGQGKLGRVGVVSSEQGIANFKYQPLDTQKEGSWIELDKRVEQKIIFAHNWDAVLAGISRESAFGNGSQYIRAAFDAKKAMVLKPEADYLIQKFIKPLVAIAAEHMKKPDWLKYEFAFKHSMPFSLLSDIDVNSVLTVDEGREILGQTEMEDPKIGKQIIEQGSKNNKPKENVPGEPPKA